MADGTDLALVVAIGSLSAWLVWLAWDGPSAEGLGGLGVALAAMALGALVAGIAWVAGLVAAARTGVTPGRAVVGTRLAVSGADGRWRIPVAAVLNHIGVVAVVVAVPWFVASLTEPPPEGPLVAGLAAGVAAAAWLAVAWPASGGRTLVERATGTVTVARAGRRVGRPPRQVPFVPAVALAVVMATVVAAVVPDRPAHVWEDVAAARAALVGDLEDRGDARRICDRDVRALLASHMSGPCGDPDRWWLVDGPVDARGLAVLVDAVSERPATVTRPGDGTAVVALDDRDTDRVVAVVLDRVCGRVPVGVGDWRSGVLPDVVDQLRAFAREDLSCASGS